MILSVISWPANVRLVRTLTLSEVNRDYVEAAKISGTPWYKILFSGILPNISSTIISDYALTLAGSIWIDILGLWFEARDQFVRVDVDGVEWVCFNDLCSVVVMGAGHTYPHHTHIWFCGFGTSCSSRNGSKTSVELKYN